MIVLEKWIPNKPISAIYFDGEKEKHYVKRFLIENENRGRCIYFRACFKYYWKLFLPIGVLLQK